MRTVILLECSVPPELDRAQALGAISGVLAQHGALGVHATAIGDITVSLAAAANVDHGIDEVDTIRALVFDRDRTARHVSVGGAL